MNKYPCLLLLCLVTVSCHKVRQQNLPDELKGKWVHVYSVKQSEYFTTSSSAPPGYHTGYSTIPKKENCLIEFGRKHVLLNDNGEVKLDEKCKMYSSREHVYAIHYGEKKKQGKEKVQSHFTVELRADTLKIYEFFPYDGYYYDNGNGHDIGDHYVNYFVKQ